MSNCQYIKQQKIWKNITWEYFLILQKDCKTVFVSVEEVLSTLCLNTRMSLRLLETWLNSIYHHWMTCWDNATYSLMCDAFDILTKLTRFSMVLFTMYQYIPTSHCLSSDMVMCLVTSQGCDSKANYSWHCI